MGDRSLQLLLEAACLDRELCSDLLLDLHTASSPSPNSRLSTRSRDGAFLRSPLRYQSVKCSDFSLLSPLNHLRRGLSSTLVHVLVFDIALVLIIYGCLASLFLPCDIYRLTRELEKKFSDRTVVFVAQRRMMRKPGRTSRAKQPRPRSRTLKAVHDAILDDLVYPSEITGKRTRQSTDGNRTIKVYVYNA